MNKVFQYLSYLFFPFFIWGVSISFPELITRSSNIISNIGMGIFLCGIALSFDGLKEKKKFTKIEIKIYSNPKLTKFYFGYQILSIAVCFLIGLFFFNLKWFYVSAPLSILKSFKDLGYGLFSFGVGLIGQLKTSFNLYSKIPAKLI